VVRAVVRVWNHGVVAGEPQSVSAWPHFAAVERGVVPVAARWGRGWQAKAPAPLCVQQFLLI
jgi:hypothetical protein